MKAIGKKVGRLKDPSEPSPSEKLKRLKKMRKLVNANYHEKIMLNKAIVKRVTQDYAPEELVEIKELIQDVEDDYQPIKIIPVGKNADYTEERLRLYKHYLSLIEEIEVLKHDRALSGYNDKETYVPGMKTLMIKYKLLPMQIVAVWKNRNTYKEQSEMVFTALKVDVRCLAFDSGLIMLKEINRRVNDEETLKNMSGKELRENLNVVKSVITAFQPEVIPGNRRNPLNAVVIDIDSISADVIEVKE